MGFAFSVALAVTIGAAPTILPPTHASNVPTRFPAGIGASNGS